MPNGERAFVDLRKLTDYLLNPDHPYGKHKARVFAAALGLTADDASVFRDSLLNAAVQFEAVPSDRDEFGERFVVDFIMEGPTGSAQVRSAWIIRTGENYPRLTSSYVLQ